MATKKSRRATKAEVYRLSEENGNERLSTDTLWAAAKEGQLTAAQELDSYLSAGVLFPKELWLGARVLEFSKTAGKTQASMQAMLGSQFRLIEWRPSSVVGRFSWEVVYADAPRLLVIANLTTKAPQWELWEWGSRPSAPLLVVPMPSTTPTSWFMAKVKAAAESGDLSGIRRGHFMRSPGGR